jgi:hypothetical protein
MDQPSENGAASTNNQQGSSQTQEIIPPQMHPPLFGIIPQAPMITTPYVPRISPPHPEQPLPPTMSLRIAHRYPTSKVYSFLFFSIQEEERQVVDEQRQ